MVEKDIGGLKRLLEPAGEEIDSEMGFLDL